MFFEAVMRNGGFTAASSELYVSQAAVSKRIRQLEEWLGAPLFERGARTLTPTPAAEKLAEPVSMALDYINSSLNSIKPQAKLHVRVASNNAVSVFWLLPRIRAFALSDASCPVESVVSDDPVSLLAAEHDLVITYGSAPPDGWTGVRLMDEELVPAIAPDRLSAFQNAPHDMLLLDYDRNAPDWINWDVWIKQNPGSALSALPRQRCETYSHSIGRAISGEGIALASCALLRDELNTGALIALGVERYKTGKSYFLVHRAGVSLHDGAAGFAHFLQAFGTSL
ncbi:LysR family transcriptional regulator [Aliiroseovarius crassostreae]|uniref:LysR family transcriptional regulator n=1 Tax=Aliiroseovarius crassostreae TaxID=154981 RepID=UPI0021F93E19|nr:LysR family transcriptional regulator [Aliiroseovarius crassostreae]UWP88847.1 LysR family transcriptional regulator [Aliiroseovarius crassostreae]